LRLQGAFITLILVLVGLFLAASSSLGLPLGYGVPEFWLGIVVLVGGSIWFGGWGVIAAALFPFLSSLLIQLDLVHSLAVIPGNVLEGLIPAYAFRSMAADPALRDARSVRVYVLWSTLIPSLLGGLVTSSLWILIGDADWHTVALLGFDWAVSNSVVLIVVGFPMLYILTPHLRERHWLVRGWWS